MGPTKISQDDQNFNINFVEEVKKHPCLFDSNNPEYKQASEQDKAWQAVAVEMGEALETCKKRWRNLRCCMTRYLKSMRDTNDVMGSGRRKPYYLYTHMQFVLPYLKVREEGANFEPDESSWIKQNSSGTEGMLKQHNVEEEDDDDDDDDDDEEPDAPEIEAVDVPDDDHHQQQLKQSIIQSIKILPMGQETQSHEQQHEAMSAEETTGTTTTTYEIIAAPPIKQPRLSNPRQSVESISNATSPHGQTSADVKKEILGQQYYTITGTPTHSTNVTMPCFNNIGQQHTANFSQASQAPTHLQPQTAQHFALIPSATVVNDADNNFFQSLIPDIHSMTMEQKRKLRIGILQLIDGILNT